MAQMSVKMAGRSVVLRCICVLISFAATAEAVLSGLYIGNGKDQTVIHHAMTRNERLVVEHEILDLLGLAERPRRRTRSPPLDHLAAPSFLLDVYKQLEEEPEQTRPTRSSELALSGDEQQAIDESDLIMTFQSKKHHLGALRHGHGRHVWFEVAGAPGDSSSLMTAELRVHQSPKYTSSNISDLYNVVIHRVISVDSLGGLELDRVVSVNTSAGSEGWLEFNVTNALAAWLDAPADNRGFFITVHPHTQPERSVKPEEIGLEEPHGVTVEGKQPFVVAFFKNSPKLTTTDASARRKRDARRWRQGYSENYVHNPLTDSSHWTTRSCEIQTLYVSFKDLEWQDWIIAPDGYGAFYCSGECNFPLNAHKNATNHAIVQTLVHLINPLKVPKPSCAPIKLSPISVLYYTDDSNVILRKYKNMVVKSCGCH